MAPKSGKKLQGGPKAAAKEVGEPWARDRRCRGCRQGRRRRRRCLPPPPCCPAASLPQAAKEAQLAVRDAYAAYRSKAHDPAAADRSIDALQGLVLQGGPGAPAACVALVKVGPPVHSYSLARCHFTRAVPL